MALFRSFVDLKHFYNSCRSNLDKGETSHSSDELLTPTLPLIHSGKVRDIFRNENNTLRLFHTDKLSAFDRAICEVPYKGAILSQLSAFWCRKMEEEGIAHHLVSEVSSRELDVMSLKMIPVEIVVRGYLAGSMARAYADGVRVFCGVELPEGLKPYSKLPEPIITPTTKADVYDHDEPISEKEILASGLVEKDVWYEAVRMSLQLFHLGQEYCDQCGWLLVDTKYEIGVDGKGRLRVADEVHTPDSSRFWKKDSYSKRLNRNEHPEMFDKENIRSFLLGQGFDGTPEVVPEIPMKLVLDLAETYLTVAEQMMKKSVII